jgi:hypothetical protein
VNEPKPRSVEDLQLLAAGGKAERCLLFGQSGLFEDEPTAPVAFHEKGAFVNGGVVA